MNVLLSPGFWASTVGHAKYTQEPAWMEEMNPRRVQGSGFRIARLRRLDFGPRVSDVEFWIEGL